MTPALRRRIRRTLDRAGYSAGLIASALAYVAARPPADARDAMALAVARVLYDDGQMADLYPAGGA